MKTKSCRALLLLLTMGLVNPTAVFAKDKGTKAARPHIGGQYDQDYGDDFYFEEGRGQKEKVVKRLDQYVSAQTTLRLKRLLGLNQYRGMKVKKIILVGEGEEYDYYPPIEPYNRDRNRPGVPRNPRRPSQLANVRLMINKGQVGRVQLLSNGMQRRLVFQVPERKSILGEDIRSMQLKISGSAYLKKVVAVLEDAYGGGRDQVVRKNVYLRKEGHNVLPLRRILELGPRLNGKAVKSVTLVARTDRGRGKASLLVNGRQVGMPKQVGMYEQEYTFYLNGMRNKLGMDIRNLEIQLQGRFDISEVAVKLGKKRGSGPIYPPRTEIIREYPNMGMSGRNTFYLEELLNLPNYKKDALVKSVKIVASSARANGLIELCTGSFDCLGKKGVGTRRTTLSFPIYKRVRLSNLEVNTKGKLNIQEVIVEIDRRL